MEVRHDVTERIGAVLFVDAGTVGEHPYFDLHSPSVGAGFGVRYNLGFAPLRADIGFPLNPRQGDGAFQVYISIGQAF